MIDRKLICCVCLLLTSLSVAAVGCSSSTTLKETITLATTTSTRDSGLVDVLVPMFEQQTGIEVKVIAVGSGQALEMGRRGDADLLLTHAPAAEEKFMSENYGIERRAVMYNDFVLVGPKSDPAGVQGETSIAEAFSQIAATNSPFVSRGDNSGTHMKENQIWSEARIETKSDWYIQSGSGMAQTLRVTNEKRAYTLSDRGTFLSQRDQLDLVVISEGDPLLLNRYTVMLTNPEKHTHVREAASRKFAEFLVSPKVQKLIGSFGVEKFGEPLFFTDEE